MHILGGAFQGNSDHYQQLIGGAGVPPVPLGAGACCSCERAREVARWCQVREGGHNNRTEQQETITEGSIQDIAVACDEGQQLMGADASASGCSKMEL